MKLVTQIYNLCYTPRLIMNKKLYRAEIPLSAMVQKSFPESAVYSPQIYQQQKACIEYPV